MHRIPYAGLASKSVPRDIACFGAYAPLYESRSAFDSRLKPKRHFGNWPNSTAHQVIWACCRQRWLRLVIKGAERPYCVMTR